MEGVAAANGVAVDHGHGAVHWEVLRAKVRILWYVMQARHEVISG